MYCKTHDYEYEGEECPGCQSTAEGECQFDDTTLVVEGGTAVKIEHVKLTAISDGEGGVSAELLDGADARFSGSFSVEFEDEDDAREFWDWLHDE